MSLIRIQILSLLITVLGTLRVSAQYVSERGWFEVNVINDCTGGCSGNTVRGCEGLQIIIRMTAAAPCDCFDPLGCSGCIFDYLGDGFVPPEIKSDPDRFTYTQSGSLRLGVLFPQPLGADFINVEINGKTPPGFNIFSCANRSIQVDIQDNQYNSYIIDFGDGSPEVEIPLGAPNQEHNYATTAQRTVSVRGIDTNSADNCSPANEALTPVVAIPPSSFDSLVSLDVNSLALYYDLQPDILHRMEIRVNGRNWTSFSALLEDTNEQDTIQNLDLENNSYCFRIRSIDPCLGLNSVAATSPVICNVRFNVAFEDDVNVLSWLTEEPVADFEFNRTGGGSILNRPGLTGTSFNDEDIDCNIDYCYTLTANYAAGFISRSLERCGTSFSTVPPDAVNNVTVSVDGTAIDISWPEITTEPIAQYRVLRGSSANNLGPITSLTTTAFRDEGLLTDETSFCYRIDATDECGNANRNGVVACSMLLTGSISRDNTVRLEWNDYEGWQNGVRNYVIEKSYVTGPAAGTTTTVSELEEADNNAAEQVIRYKVRAVPIDNTLTEAFSNEIILIKPNNIYYPNAFTPNNNSVNESFTVNGRFIVSYVLNIFNRWGELVFTSDNPETGWDGTLEGKRLPVGTYAFKAEIVDQAGRELTETGTILLMR